MIFGSKTDLKLVSLSVSGSSKKTQSSGWNWNWKCETGINTDRGTFPENKSRQWQIRTDLWKSTVVCVIFSMKFVVISIVTGRDITETNSFNFKIHLPSECLGSLWISRPYIILNWLRWRTQNTSLVILTTARFASTTENYETLSTASRDS